MMMNDANQNEEEINDIDYHGIDKNQAPHNSKSTRYRFPTAKSSSPIEEDGITTTISGEIEVGSATSEMVQRNTRT
jgi:hypothetical protein